MKKSKLALLTALFCVGAAGSAFADYDNVGSVKIDFGRDRDVHRFDFGGPVDKLQLRAARSDIDCRSVTANFGNGQSRMIFHGRLRQDRPANVDLPGDQRNIRSLAFNCGAHDRSGGEIRIAADIGNGRDAWRRGPNWQRQWSRMFNWGSNAINNWQLIGTERFDGRRDHETNFAGLRGRSVDTIALKPTDADARCSRVTAHFGNGKTQMLNLHNGDRLRRGQYESVDLPGNVRNLRSLSLDCRAINARQVTIQIFVSK